MSGNNQSAESNHGTPANRQLGPVAVELVQNYAAIVSHAVKNMRNAEQAHLNNYPDVEKVQNMQDKYSQQFGAAIQQQVVVDNSSFEVA